MHVIGCKATHSSGVGGVGLSMEEEEKEIDLATSSLRE